MNVEDVLPENGSYAEITVGVDVRGDGLRPDEITRGLGMQPTRVLSKGSSWPGQPGRVASIDAWVSWSPLSVCLDLEARVKDAVAALRARAHVLKQLREQGLLITLCVAIYGHGKFPAISLSSPTIAELGELGLALDIDCYGTDRGDNCT